MNHKRKPLNNSYSTHFLGTTTGPQGFATQASGMKIGIPAGNPNSTQKSMIDSFYSHRGSSIGIGEPKKKRNLGVTLSKLELPARLVQQKELFNEMSGWLTQANKQKEVSQSQASTKRSFHHKLLSTQTNYYQPNHSHTQSFVNIEAHNLEKKKPNFYDHKNIFRVKDFRQLKNREDKIAKSVDDPISIAQRRLLIQEFEMKVQQFLKILKIKKELGAKSYEKFYKTVEQSMGGLDTLNLTLHNRAHSSQSMNLFQNSQNTVQNSQNIIPFQTTQETQNSNSSFQNNLNTQNGVYPSHVDSVISQNAQQKKNLQNIQNQSVQQVNQGDMNSSNNTSELSQTNYNTSGQKQTSFIDRSKDIAWQYNTYYQINQHQFQELSEKQISFLTNEEREQYYTVLNHFKSVGHRFQVQVQVQQQKTSITEMSDYIQEEVQQGNLLPTIQSKSKKQLTQGSHQNSRLALHQRLQDYILEKCRNYLNSDNTDYDEKLRMMKKQYEQMLDNFEKKSHKVWLPNNMRPRGQDYNDFYVYEDPDDLKKLLKETFEDLTEENFGSVLSINMSLVNNESVQKAKTQNEILIEDDLPVHAEESEEEIEQEEEEESSYVETPYSQKKARNKMKFKNKQAASKYAQQDEDQDEQPPEPKQPKQKKKKPPQITQIEDGSAPTKQITPLSVRSDQSDDSDMNFTKSYNQRFKSGSIKSNDASPLPRQKPSSSQFNKKIKTPQSNRSSQGLDSENEDKVEDNKESARGQRNNGRSQFSKKAQPPSVTQSKKFIDASDLNTSNSVIANDNDNDKSKEKKDYDNNDQEDPQTPKSIEALSLSPKERTKKKITTQKSDDSGGFEQAKDELEDLIEGSPAKRQDKNDKVNQNNKSNKGGSSNFDIQFDLDDDQDPKQITSRKKIGGNQQSDTKVPGSKRNIATGGGQPGSSKQIGSSQQKLSKERSMSNASNKSNQSTSGQGQNKGQHGESSFKQKIQNEIMMENEQNKVYDNEGLETVIIGTGLFDRMLACSNYLDFDLDLYQSPSNKAPVNPTVQFKSDADRQVFTRICQWEQEVSEQNENYSQTQDTIIQHLIQVQQDIQESKKKKKGSNTNIGGTKKKIKKGDTSSQNEYSDTSIRNQDSVIESISQYDVNNSHLQETSFFHNKNNYKDRSPSNASQINRSVSQSINRQNSGNMTAIGKQSGQNSPLNKSINEQQSPLSASGKGFHLNLSKIGQKESQKEKSPIPPQNKKKFETNPTESDERAGLGFNQKKSISSDTEESKDSQISLLNLENIKASNSNPSASDRSSKNQNV